MGNTPMKASHVLTVVVVVASVTLPTTAGSQPQQPSRSHNAAKPDSVMRDFKARIDDYLKLHDKAVKAAPALEEAHNPRKIKNAQDVLGARIRELIAGAKQGDIFTPEIAARFKDLLSPAPQGEDRRDAKRVLKDDAPAAVPLHVNAKLPIHRATPVRAFESSVQPADSSENARVPDCPEAIDSARCGSRPHRRLHSECNSVGSAEDFMRRLFIALLVQTAERGRVLHARQLCEAPTGRSEKD
jgi:hypothetical protein